MQIDEDNSIRVRLGTPPVRPAGDMSAAALVRRHYHAIRQAWMQERHLGKTWAEIGRDLRPSNPIPGGTVGRAFQRVTAERAREAAAHIRETDSAGEKAAIKTQSADTTRAPNIFARTIDPIRLSSGKEA